MKIRWNQWIAGYFLLGILSKGYAVNWMPEEDNVVIEFVESCMSNPELTWQNCSDAVNQCLETMGFDHRRTAGSCRKRWERHLRNGNQSSSQFHKAKRCSWTENENVRLMESVRRHVYNGRVDWVAVSRDVENRTEVQCRSRYSILASHGFPPEGVLEEEQQNGEFNSADPDASAYDGDFEYPFEGSPFEDY
jgi:hypothetical protein